jgi:hypothetical protein
LYASYNKMLQNRHNRTEELNVRRGLFYDKILNLNFSYNLWTSCEF